MNRRKLLATSVVAIGTLFVKEKDSKAEEVAVSEARARVARRRTKECQENIQKARNALEILAGYSQQEIDEIRKAVAKHLPKAKGYKEEFLSKAWHLSLGQVYWPYSKFVEIWCAIAVTFCSAGLVDGFAALDIEIPATPRPNLIA